MLPSFLQPVIKLDSGDHCPETELALFVSLQKSLIESPAKPHPKCTSQVGNSSFLENTFPNEM